MGAILTIIFFTTFWAAVARVGPRLMSKAPQQDLVRCCFLLAAVCCWLFWFCCYLAQLNPLIGPKLKQDTIKMIARSWDNPIVG
ncbi:hypothetical protein KR074_000219 [Drosophila pseudoananassae]|nr:hypothetical protein KR074_000219 [Drosophila pseudoananassae]